VRIATGSWRSSAELKLAAAGLEDAVPLFACDGRPAREAIVTAAIDSIAGTATAPLQRMVSIGDGVWDVRTAARLGLPFLGVGRDEMAERLRRAGAQIVLPDFADLEHAVYCLETAAVPTT
jgi:phosphoglycolate phosphatase-like HAD superfamily hydrolase